jgi:DNA-binding response OmpR family regulator
MKLFLLEDDPVLAQMLIDHLQSQHFDLTHCYDGLEAEARLLSDRFDLLLLDVSVPGMSGFELLKGLRALQDQTPAIFITALQGSADLKKGFALGADDYIRKPFDLDELDARLTRSLQRHRLSDEVIVVAPAQRFWPRRCMVEIEGESVPLRRMEAALLGYLLRHRGRTVSSEELMNNLYSYDEPRDSATLRTYIKNLRRILGADSIRTVRGVGYLYESL